ncbi:O-antigen ligase family protein [Ascidiimonas aurantiaca]|uniref:O-antigen ligase family protein n=1 Tax=Ascidiimonas aurantiaca TaxID=1685432 RepID=UPI0030EF2746
MQRSQIKNIQNTKELRWLLLHVVLGVAIYLVPALAKAWGLLVLSLGVLIIFNTKNRNHEVLLFCGYMVGSDVFLRMTGGDFFYEQIKYSIIVLLVLSMFVNRISSKSIWYLLYAVLLIPGIFVAAYDFSYESDLRKSLSFNLSGPICLAVCAIYCYERNVSFRTLQNILFFTLLPIITMTIYLFIFTPNLQDVITGTQSNFEASGGFGPNQVSTILGLGMFILFIRFFFFSNTLLWKLINLGLLAAVAYRGLLTFSRGGIITATVISIAAILSIMYFTNKTRVKRKVLTGLSLLSLVFLVVWMYSNVISKGLLEKRYNNQNAAGIEKEDVSTGRLDLIETELIAFFENPIFGIGVGNNKFHRKQITGIDSAAHNEVSRTIAEHGSLGILAFMIVFLTPVTRFLTTHRNVFFFSFFLFWFLTINHSAMRIAAPAFIYALSLLTITSENNTLHREQTTA